MPTSVCSRIFTRGFPILLVFALSGLQRSALGQNTGLKQRAADSRRVVLDVVSTSPLISASDVVVTDNDKKIAPENIRALSTRDGSDAQPQVLLVIDAVNGSEQDVVRTEDAVGAILKQTKGPLAQPTAIVVLSDVAAPTTAPEKQTGNTAAIRPQQLYAHRIPPTTNPGDLAKALDSYKVGLHRILQSQAGPGQAERVQLSLQALSFLAKGEASQPGPKVVVWISPGWPFLAKSDARSSDQLFDSVIYFSDLLRAARMIVYFINPQGVTAHDQSGETEAFLLSSRPSAIRANGYAPNAPVQLSDDYYKNFLQSPRRGSESSPNDLTLQVMAIQSGGLVFQHNNNIRSQIEQCLSDAGHISSLSYDPGPSEGSTEYHAVQVRRSTTSELLRSQSGFYQR